MTTVPIVNHRASVPAVFVENFDREEDGVPAGHFNYAQGYSEPDGPPVCLMFGCPCGCGSLNAVNVRPYPKDNPDPRPNWQWDGNEQCPTLTPSILIYQLDDKGERIGEHWHGFLTSGEFRSC